MTLYETAECMNTLAAFLGRRDIPELTEDALRAKYGFLQADVMVLCGSGLLAGADVMAEAIRNRAAKLFIIAGGVGHTTPDLRKRILSLFPDVPGEQASEAELFQYYLRKKYGLQADYLDTASRNSGENILNALEILKKNSFPARNMILCQDAALQLRMDASLRRYAPEILPVNFAAYEAETAVRAGVLYYRKAPGEMWDIPRFRSLLMGEIPRLSDSPEGYGPKGMNFLAHVNIPEPVQDAFLKLLRTFPDSVRQAIPQSAAP